MFVSQLVAVSIGTCIMSSGSIPKSAELLTFTKMTKGRLWIGCQPSEHDELSRAFKELASLSYQDLRRICKEYLDYGMYPGKPFVTDEVLAELNSTYCERELRALKSINVGLVSRLKYYSLFASDPKLDNRFGRCWILGINETWAVDTNGNLQLSRCGINQYDPIWVGSGINAIAELDYCERLLRDNRKTTY